MTAPNIINVTSITGKTVSVTPANTTANTLVSNAASSSAVLKINSITATNVDGTSAVNASVFLNSAAAGAGTNSAMASTISVPANAVLVLLDKATIIYLEEDKSLVVQSGAANNLVFICSYELIS